MNWNRILSGVLALLYVVGAYAHAGAEFAWKVAIGVLFPLACIWFSDGMGNYIGPSPGGRITSSTPGCFVCLGGWLLLLLPIVVWIVYALSGSHA
jgi:hypothetical protein